MIHPPSKPSAVVHACGVGVADHPLHRTVGMVEPGVYLITQRGCVGRVRRFDTEAEAQAAGQAWLKTARRPS
jgi:hypothetical protein